jgi:glycerate 2-kinase
MNILIATDKFKDSATAAQIGKWLEKGIHETLPSALFTHRPLADGGEGTLDAIATNLGGIWKECVVNDPLFRPVKARYLYLTEQAIAIIEMSQASGLQLLNKKERNCLITTSLGTGELIVDALKSGAKEIVLAVGGTATNDAGMGIATALGFSFLDQTDAPLNPVGQDLTGICRIDRSKVLSQVANTKWTIATDVQNPFYGLNGAAHVFAPQKGATPAGVLRLEAGLQQIARVFVDSTSQDPQTIVGSGAGGGVAGGLACLLNARIISGADWVLEINKIAETLEHTDLLITGEGKVDSQTWGGKLIAQLLVLAQTANVPTIVVCGTLTDVDMIAKQPSVIYATSIMQGPMSLENAISNTKRLTTEQGILLGKLLPKLLK